MPPTIQIGTIVKQEIKQEKDSDTINKKSELLLKISYSNSLPDFPFDLKFIKYPFSPKRYVEYKPTSLEYECKYEFLTEPDLGMEIDVVNQEIFATDFNAQLDPADEKLLEEEIFIPQDSKRSKHHAQNVSWLRRTEYISTEQTRFQPQTVEKVEAKVGYNIKKMLTEGILYMDRKTQLEAINKTFKDNRTKIERHHSKPNVVPVEILPVFPDFKMWKYPCAQVIFDTDPAPTGRPVPSQNEEMCQAMIRGVKDESGEQFVAYFLPTQETVEKRRRGKLAEVNVADDEEYDYKISREYNWNMRSKTSVGYEENYFLVVRNDGIYYNELETRVRLCKRRQNYNQPVNNTRLVVRNRKFTNDELKDQRVREKQLEAFGYEDSDQEKEESHPKTQRNENNDESEVQSSSSVDSRRKSRSRSRSKSVSSSRSSSKSSSRSGSRSLSSGSRSESKSRSETKSPNSSNKSCSSSSESEEN